MYVCARVSLEQASPLNLGMQGALLPSPGLWWYGVLYLCVLFHAISFCCDWNSVEIIPQHVCVQVCALLVQCFDSYVEACCVFVL